MPRSRPSHSTTRTRIRNSSPLRIREAARRHMLYSVKFSCVLLLRPEDALLWLRHRRKALVDELLHSLASPRLRSVEIASRISDDAMHGIELSGLASAVTNRRQRLECVSLDDVDLFV